MCRDVGMEPLADIVARMIEGLAIDSGRTEPTARTQAGHPIAGRVLKFVPRKGPATEAAGQVYKGGEQTVAVGETSTRGTAPLGTARRRAKL